MGFRSRLLFPAILTALSLAGTVPLAASTDWEGTVHFTLGPKLLHDDFEPVEHQFQGGFSVAFQRSGWPVKLVFDAMTSTGDEADSFVFNNSYNVTIRTDVDTMELGFGVQKSWAPGRIHPTSRGAWRDSEATWRRRSR